MNASPAANPVLDINGLRGGWGLTTVIEDLSLSLLPGETVSVVGRNGVGKSTLLELIAGRATRHSGQIQLDAIDMTELPIFERARLGIGYVPQQREVFPSLTVMEHFAIAARPGYWNVQRICALFPALTQRIRSLGKELSGGEQQMLAIARALIGNPKVLLMDEPSEGLAPVVVDQLALAMREVVQDRRLTVLLVEQRVDIALDLSQRCVVMDRGKIAFECESEALHGDAAQLIKHMGFER